MSKPAKISDWIIFENENYAVINKPAFVPSVSERGKYTHKPVIEMAREKWPDSTLSHRLDRETSGALIIAKNAEAYRNASIQFEKRKISKIYHAVIDGIVDFEETTVDLPIDISNLAKIHINRKTGKRAMTLFQTIEKFRHFSLVECKPVTGRLHQIRVHLESQNARISGDILYGSTLPLLSQIKKKMNGEDTVLIQRFALHARQIIFKDIDGSEIRVEAPYPKDMEVFLKLLHKYDMAQ